MPENKSALAFWRKAIAIFTSNQYSEEIKRVDCRGGLKAERLLSTFKHSGYLIFPLIALDYITVNGLLFTA